MSDPTVSAFLTKVLCANGGRLPRDQLHQHLELPPAQIELILQEEPRRFPLSGDLVLARSSVRTCQGYLRGQEEEEECERLHLCRYFLQGKCWPGRRPPCRFSHNIQSPHNRTVLKANEISGLDEKELKVLLFQNDNLMLPEICVKHLKDSCDQGEACARLHVCGYFTRGECNRRVCKRSHNLLEPRAMVLHKRRWITDVSIENFQMLCIIAHKEFLQSLGEDSGSLAWRGAHHVPRNRGRSRGKGASRSRSKDGALDEQSRRRGEAPHPRRDSSSQKAADSDERDWTSPAGWDDDRELNMARGELLHVYEEELADTLKKLHALPLAPVNVSTAASSSVQVTTSTTAKAPVNGATGRTSVSVQPKAFDVTSARANPPVNVPNAAPFIVQPMTSARANPPVNVPNAAPFIVQPMTFARSNPPVNVPNAAPSIVQPMTFTRANPPVNIPNAAPSIVQPMASARANPPVSVPNAAPSIVQPMASARANPPVSVPTAASSIVQPTTSLSDIALTRKAPGNVPTAETSITTSARARPPVNDNTKASLARGYTLSSEPYVTALNTAQPRVPHILKPLFKPQAPGPPSEDLLNDPLNRSPSVEVPLSMATPTASVKAYYRVPSPVNVTSYKGLSTAGSGNQPDAFIKKDDKKAEVNEICLFHIWQFCKLVNKCTQMHYHLPYRWQYLASTEWTDLPNMEEIEKAFCDPKINRTSVVDFQTMKRNLTIPVRRASTVSSVTRSSEFVLTTEWVWHWQDEHGTWIEYGKSSTTQQSASILSADLENIYLADQKATVPFQAGKQIYEINFQEMVQRNVTYKTQKEVRRRPRFLSFDDVRKLRGSTKSVQAISPLKTGAYPPNWDSKALPDLGYQLVDVPSKSAEYTKILGMFTKTVSGHVVKKMQRVQNPSLWQVFQWQKEQMKKTNRGGDVDERHLFHGTDRTHFTAICHQNFDWRICGTHGTLYGKGSYFARDASYSHNYAAPSKDNIRTMFVARVLVGDQAVGNPSLLRPPPKHGSSTHAYDSCVDTLFQPSIFVVFEKHQIYPEYVLEYEEEKKQCCVS